MEAATFVKNFYRWYLSFSGRYSAPGNAFVDRPEFPGILESNVTAEFFATYAARREAANADPLTLCQDRGTDWSATVDAALASQDGGGATVAVRFGTAAATSFPVARSVAVVREDGRWRIADVA